MAANFCSQCGNGLREGDQYCAQCGQRITTAENGDTGEVVTFAASGSNRLLFEQTLETSKFEAAFTDNTAQHLANVLQTLVDGNVIRPVTRHIGTSAVLHEDVIVDDDTPAESHFGQRQEHIGISTSPSALTENDRVAAPFDIDHIFSTSNGILKLEMPKLKAKTVTDNVTRLARMALYYMQHHNGGEHVPRKDLYEFFERSGIKGGTYRPIVSADNSINRDKNNALLFLNTTGEQQVRQYLNEINNSEIEEGWYLGKDSGTPLQRKRRISRRIAEQEDEIVLAAFTEPVEHLRHIVQSRHGEVTQWQTNLKVQLALYTLRLMHGTEFEASCQSISQLLDSAFEIQVPSDTVRKAVERAVQSKSRCVNRGRRGHFRINHSGVKNVEDLLNISSLEMPQRSPEEAQARLFEGEDVPDETGDTAS